MNINIIGNFIKPFLQLLPYSYWFDFQGYKTIENEIGKSIIPYLR